MTGRPKPIAYGNGTSGGVYHTQCWYDYADDHFKGQRARAFLGTIYYPGSKELKNEKCKWCSKGFEGGPS